MQLDEQLQQRKESALATADQSKRNSKIATRKKRSRVQLNSAATAKTIEPQSVNAAPGSAQDVALSAADAFKSATATAYTSAMSEAVPELFDFMAQVNDQVGAYMIDQINQAYGVEPAENEVA